MAIRRDGVKGDTRPATMEDVARQAGVSRALVSLVMRGSPQVSAASRSRVLDAAAALGYRPNAIARSLASRTNRTIGVLLNDLHNPFFAEIIDGVEGAAETGGYRTLLSTGGRRKRREEAALEAMLEFRVGGLILVSSLLSPGLIASTARTCPVVVVSRTVRCQDVDSVVTDEIAGVRLAVEHLLALGHRRIVHIDGGADPSGPLRRRGYEKAMRATGNASLIVAGDFSEAGGAKAADEILRMRQRPTAIVAANDLAAAGAMERLEEAGLSVPDDMSVVGFDNTYLAALRQVSLTTINQPRDTMGRLAVNALVERITGARSAPVRHVVSPSLIVRRSTGPAPSS